MNKGEVVSVEYEVKLWCNVVGCRNQVTLNTMVHDAMDPRVREIAAKDSGWRRIEVTGADLCGDHPPADGPYPISPRRDG